MHIFSRYFFLVTLIISSNVFFTSKAFSQEKVTLTVPYEFVDIDPRITRIKLDCTVNAGDELWGEGSGEAELTYSPAAIGVRRPYGEVAVEVFRTNTNISVSGLRENKRDTYYECRSKVAINPNSAAGWQEMGPNAEYDFARTSDSSRPTKTVVEGNFSAAR